MSDNLERIIDIKPAYDCIGVQPCVFGSKTCNPGTGSSHGRHNAELHMTVRGSDAEVTLVVGTGWDLPSVPSHARVNRLMEKPNGCFVELHTARPRYEDQEREEPRKDGTCRDWPGCYISTGYRLADEPTALLVSGGSDAAWAWIENLYAETQAEMNALQRV